MARPLATDHCFSWVVSSAFDAFPSTANGVTASLPSHLTKLCQLNSPWQQLNTNSARLPNFVQDLMDMQSHIFELLVFRVQVTASIVST